MASVIAIPKHVRILVIGGGPAGSYAAACLAREGVEVAVFEADKFPRYHVGESQLASLRHFLRFIDLDKTFLEHGFQRKNGAAFKLNPFKREGYTNFVAEEPENYSWNLVRSESDELLFRHAGACGASIFEEVKVLSLEYDGEGDGRRFTSAQWRTKEGEEGTTTFDFVIDASGRNGIISTRYMKTRTYNQTLKNVASWGYWRDCKNYSPETMRKGAPFFEALHDESGWAWFIPLHNGVTSVGLVMNQAISIAKKSKAPENDTLSFYLQELKAQAPDITGFISSGSLIKDKGPIVRSASDFSYSASSYAGLNYRISGDAGAFIDPFFSSGVHLAVAGGLGAAASICSVIRGEATSEEMAKWYTTRTGTAYTRFLLVVLGAYQQMRNQAEPVLSDFNEEDFDRAFGHFRSIIQGKIDVEKNLKQDELRDTILFCKNAWGGTAEERATGRQFLQAEDKLPMEALVSDAIEGFKLRLQKGSLGLERV